MLLTESEIRTLLKEVEDASYKEDITESYPSGVVVTAQDLSDITKTANYVYGDKDNENEDPPCIFHVYESIQEAITRKSNITKIIEYKIFEKLSIFGATFVLYHVYVKNQKRLIEVLKDQKKVDDAYTNVLINWIPKTEPNKDLVIRINDLAFPLRQFVDRVREFYILCNKSLSKDELKILNSGTFKVPDLICSYLKTYFTNSKILKKMIKKFKKDMAAFTVHRMFRILCPEIYYDLPKWIEISNTLDNARVNIQSELKAILKLKEGMSWLDTITMFKETHPSVTDVYKILLVGRYKGQISAHLYNGYTINEFICKKLEEDSYFEQIYNTPDYDKFTIYSIYIKRFNIVYGSGKAFTKILIANNNMFEVIYPNTTKNCLSVSAIRSQEGHLIDSTRHKLYRSNVSEYEIESYYDKKLIIYTALPNDFVYNHNIIQLYSQDSHVGYIKPYRRYRSIDKIEKETITYKEDKEIFSAPPDDIYALVFWDLEFEWKWVPSYESYIADDPNLISSVIYTNDTRKLTYKNFSSIVDFINYLLCLSACKPIICYSHNGKRIEHQFIVHALRTYFQWGATQKFIKISNVSHSDIKKFRYKNIIFADSTNVLPVSIEKLSTQFNTGINKDHEDWVAEKEILIENMKKDDYEYPKTSVGGYVKPSKIIEDLKKCQSMLYEYYTLLDDKGKKELEKSQMEKCINNNIKIHKSNWYIRKKWNLNNPKDRQYCQNDALNLASVLMIFNQKLVTTYPDIQGTMIGDIKWVIGSMSLSTIGKLLIFKENPRISIKNNLRTHFEPGYRGGRCEAFKQHSFTTDSKKKVVKIDINSSYPYQACQAVPNELLDVKPYMSRSKLMKLESKQNESIWACWCIVKYKKTYKDYPAPLIDFSTGEFFNDTQPHITLLWSFQFYNLQSNLEIVSQYTWFNFSITTLRNPLELWFELKRISQDAEKLLFKGLLNSAIGSLGIRSRQPVMYITQDNEFIRDKILQRKSESTISLGKDDCFLIKTSEPIPSYGVSHAIAACVTARARFQLYEKMRDIKLESPETVIAYCDTDAIIMHTPISMADKLKRTANDEMGGWDYNEYKYLKVVNKKKYQLDDNFTMAGIPKESNITLEKGENHSKNITLTTCRMWPLLSTTGYHIRFKNLQ